MKDLLRTVLRQKGSQVHSIEPTATVAHAVSRMNDLRIGALLVLEGGTPVGIFTERDVLRRVVDEGRDPKATCVREVMTTEVVAVPASLTVQDAMSVVTHARCRHLPVLEDGRVVGLISSGDLTRWATRQRDIEIAQLVDYITRKYPA